jgi:hypothetical protein
MFRKNHLITGLMVLLAVVVAEAFGQKVTELPMGTTIRVRMIDSLNSAKAQIGDVFHGTLEEPIQVGGKEVYPKGADVTGKVSDVHTSGRLSEPGELDLVLATIASGNRASSVETQPLMIKGEAHTKSNATKIGGGAALGAVIGAIAGGGKGAAIGTIAGAGAGTAGAAATGKREAVVESEAVLTFVTGQAAAINASSEGSEPANATQPAATNGEVRPGAIEPPGDAGAKADAGKPTVQASNGLENAFTARDRRVIRSCVMEHASELPSGITQREDLPSGAERQIRIGGTFPSDLQVKAQALPLACEQQLPQLPRDMERVVYNGRVVLINDPNQRVLDMFYLDESQ